MTSITDTRSIEIPALDTHSDWWDDYVHQVEAKSGLKWTGDGSQYGVFFDGSGNQYRAYVNPALSNEEQWTVELDPVEVA